VSNRSLYLVLVVGLAAIGVWLWRMSVTTADLPPEAPPAEIAEMPVPDEPEHIAPPPIVAEVVLPPPPAAPDPQLNVQTAAANLADLMRAGDFANFVARYMPPEMRSQMGPEQLVQMAEGMAQASTPGTREYEQTQQLIQALDSVKNMEPTLNDTGDTATYQVNVPGAPARIRFIKVDGLWYFRG
jgi:hypothetical protein